jgi:hypothetical protein
MPGTWGVEIEQPPATTELNHDALSLFDPVDRIDNIGSAFHNPAA